MAYTYASFSASDPNSELWNQVQNFLNGLTKLQQQSAKIAASDMHDGDARAVVYYTSDKAPPNGELGDSWSYTEFANSDYDTLYSDVANYLNSDNLNTIQSYYSRVTYTNAKSNDPTLTVWYQNMPS